MAVRVNLNGIKEAVQNILLAANTTTASIIDLSANLSGSKRVQQIYKIHPEMIRPQASIFPLVTCFISDKTMKPGDMAVNQLNAKRRAALTLNVVGSVWNANISTNDEDPADEDINYLMENIELALRSDSTFSNTVNWHKATECKYYVTNLDEQTHLRSGILKYECEIYY